MGGHMQSNTYDYINHDAVLTFQHICMRGVNIQQIGTECG